MKDQLIQLTIRVGDLEQMIAPFKDKSQFLDQVAAASGRSDTLADRINEINANVSLLHGMMASLQSQLFYECFNYRPLPATSSLRGLSYTAI
jgi:hypothetical protein